MQHNGNHEHNNLILFSIFLVLLFELLVLLFCLLRDFVGLFQALLLSLLRFGFFLIGLLRCGRRMLSCLFLLSSFVCRLGFLPGFRLRSSRFGRFLSLRFCGGLRGNISFNRLRGVFSGRGGGGSMGCRFGRRVCGEVSVDFLRLFKLDFKTLRV